MTESTAVTPDFPVLDHPRLRENTDYNRVIIDVFGHMEPYLPETDSWCSMPLRLTHNTAGGFQIELGPYTLDAADIMRLREAFAEYDKATGRAS